MFSKHLGIKTALVAALQLHTGNKPIMEDIIQQEA